MTETKIEGFKLHLWAVGCKDVNWIELVHNYVQWWVFGVNGFACLNIITRHLLSPHYHEMEPFKFLTKILATKV
jgi:hypothetical protein